MSSGKGASSNGRGNDLKNAIDKAFAGMPRDAQRAFQRTQGLLRNNASGIVAGGNRTTTVSLRNSRSGMPRSSNSR